MMGIEIQPQEQRCQQEKGRVEKADLTFLIQHGLRGSKGTDFSRE